MTIDLAKVIERGSYRWIGQLIRGLSSSDIPIGGSGIRPIIRHTGGTAYRIGQIGLHNAFVIDRPPLRLLYVRPAYTGYRFAAGKVFTALPRKVDYDHALGRRTAIELGFAYVLLIRLSPSANRSHGPFEKGEPVTGLNLHKLCFADRRIMDKWLGRRPHHMSGPGRVAPFRLGMTAAFGMTLKQAGVWGYAMGVEDDPLQPYGLTPI